MPHEYHEKLMVNEIICRVIYWVNQFSMKIGISQDLSPSNIVERAPHPDFNKDCMPFGSFSVTHTQMKNKMNETSEPEIALRELNESGSHYFMSLKTGKRINCC